MGMHESLYFCGQKAEAAGVIDISSGVALPGTTNHKGTLGWRETEMTD